MRPEDLQVVGAGDGFEATVELVEQLGSDAFVHASVPGGQVTDQPVVLIARANPKSPPEKGSTVCLAPSDHELVHVFDPADGRRLSG